MARSGSAAELHRRQQAVAAGAAVKRQATTWPKMAESNKAFAHYRW